MKKINEKIKKALSFLLILTMAMTSVGVSTFSAFAVQKMEREQQS